MAQVQDIQKNFRVNEFSLPSLDNREHESLEMVLKNLIKLQQSNELIDNEVNKSLDQYKQRLTDLINRIQLCKRKIQCLGGFNQALVFHSPSKFIKHHKFMEKTKQSPFINLKKMPNPQRIDTRQSNLMYHDPKLHGKYPDTKDDSLQMYLLVNSQFQQKRRNLFDGRNAITNQNQNLLGNAPKTIKCAESYLVFNSDINPYRMKKRVETTFQELPRAKKPKVDDQQIITYEAPKALQDQERLVRYEAQGIEYQYEYKDAPVFEFSAGLDDFGLDNIVSLDYQIGDAGFGPLQNQIKRNIIPEPQFVPNQQNNQPSQSTYQYTQNLQNQQQTGQLTQSQPNTQQNNFNQNQQNQNMNFQPQQQNSFPGQVNNQPNQMNQFPGQVQNNMNQPPNLMNLQQQTQQQPMMNNLQPPNLMNLQQNNQPPNLMTLQQNNMPPNINSLQPPNLNTLQQPQIQQQQPQQQPVQQQAPSGGGGGKSALLDQIRNPGIRLKKRVTKEAGTVVQKKDKKEDNDAGADGESKTEAPKKGPAGGLSLMDHLKKQIELRHAALNQKPPPSKKVDKSKVKGDSSGEEEDENEENEDSN